MFDMFKNFRKDADKHEFESAYKAILEKWGVTRSWDNPVVYAKIYDMCGTDADLAYSDTDGLYAIIYRFEYSRYSSEPYRFNYIYLTKHSGYSLGSKMSDSMDSLFDAFRPISHDMFTYAVTHRMREIGDRIKGKFMSYENMVVSDAHGERKFSGAFEVKDTRMSLIGYDSLSICWPESQLVIRVDGPDVHGEMRLTNPDEAEKLLDNMMSAGEYEEYCRKYNDEKRHEFLTADVRYNLTTSGNTVRARIDKKYKPSNGDMYVVVEVETFSPFSETKVERYVMEFDRFRSLYPYKEWPVSTDKSK